MKMNFLEYGLGKDNPFWKYPIVLLLAWTVGMCLGMIPFGIAVGVRKGLSGNDSAYDFSEILNFSAMGISLNLGLFLLMFAFAFALFVFIGLYQIFHNGSSYKRVINGTKRIRWGRVWVGVWSWGAMMIIFSVVDLLTNPDNFVFQFDIAKFIPLVFISLLIIPLQTTFEEITLRGYFAQGLARLTKSRWVAFLIPSIVFGLLHAGNPEVVEHGFWLMMPHYIMSGLVWGLISTLDDGIELAIGGHAINNVFISLFFTYHAGAFQTYAVFEMLAMNPSIKSIFFSLFTSALLVAFLSWKYKWDFSILNKRVEKTEEEVISEPEDEQNNTIHSQF